MKAFTIGTVGTNVPSNIIKIHWFSLNSMPISEVTVVTRLSDTMLNSLSFLNSKALSPAK